jgi:hypothetical protein
MASFVLRVPEEVLGVAPEKGGGKVTRPPKGCVPKKIMR